MKRVICLLVSIMILFVTGCSKEPDTSSQVQKKQLVISYSDAAFGSSWINSICSAYKKENPDTEIKLSADSNIDKKASSILEATNDKRDILFLSNTNWQYWAERNYLADLTSLYKSEVDNSKTFEKKVKSDCLDYLKYNNKYYAVPFDDTVSGFIYNKKMFEKYGWSVPKKMSEFLNLLLEIKQEEIVPIAWSGKNINDWDIIVKTWWAQNSGYDEMKKYLKLETPEVYNQKGREDALVQFSKIISDKTNSIDDVDDADNKKALNMFLNGKAAIYVGSSSIENTANQNAMENFSMAMMKIPSMDGSKDAAVSVQPSNGIIVVPESSSNKEEAKNFLKFMATDKMLRLFTSETSTPRPFYYDIENISHLTSFGKSVIEYWNNSDSIYFYSKNPLYYNVLSDWPYQGAPYLAIFKGILTPQNAVEENYEYVKENWDTLKKEAS